MLLVFWFLALKSVIDVKGRGVAAVAFQVVVHPAVQAEAVVVAGGGVAVAVAFSRVKDQSDWSLAENLQVPVQLHRLRRMDASVLFSVQNQNGRASLLDVVNRAAFEEEFPVVPDPFSSVNVKHFVGDVGSA